MLVLSIIFGILLISGGFFCIFAPINTFMSMEYYVVILLMVFGLFGIIKGIAAKRFGVSFVFSILSFIFGIAVLFRPAQTGFIRRTQSTDTSMFTRRRQ